MRGSDQRSVEVIVDLLEMLTWNLVFGGGDEVALCRRRNELIDELEAATMGAKPQD